jgi:hypothetical protein
MKVIRKNDEVEFDIDIYELDDTKSIKNRIASTLNTLSKYLIIDKDKNLNETDEIEVIDILLYIKEKKEEKLYDILSEKELSQSNISILNDILKIYIVYNMNDLFSESMQNDNTIYNLISMQYINSEDIKKIIEMEERKKIKKHTEYDYNNKIKEYLKMRNEIKKEIENLIIMERMKDEQNNIVNRKFDEIKIYEKSENFIIKKNKVSVDLNIENKITILELFNSLRLDDNVPFAKCKDFYKILKGFTPNTDWIDNPDDILKDKEERIVMKLKINNNEYIDISIVFFNNNFKMIFQFSKILISDSEILNIVKNVIKNIEISYEEVKSIDLNGYYIIKNFKSFFKSNIPLNKNIFTDMIMNNKLFSKYMTVNESDKTDKTKFYIAFKSDKIGNITFQLSLVNIEDLRISILNCSDLNKVKLFQNIFSKFLFLYSEEYNEINEFYKKYLTKKEFDIIFSVQKEDIDNFDEEKIKQSKLKYLAPEIFIKNYSSCGHKPKILKTEEEYNTALEEGNSVMIFPKNLSSTEYKKLQKEGKNPFKFDIKNRYKFVCDDEVYKYPGLLSNKNKLLPCCYKIDQTKKESKADFLNYFDIVTKKNKDKYNFYDENEDDDLEMDDEQDIAVEEKEKEEEDIEDILEENKKQQNIITTDRILNNNIFGLLPKLINDFLSDDNYILYRKGCKRGKSSFIQCVIDAIEQSQLIDINKITDEKERKEKLNDIIHIEDYDDVRSELIDLIPLCKQECYSMTIEEIYNIIENENKYFDPRMFIRLLEYKYDINIYIFRKDKDMESLILPYHTKQYYKMREKKKCILIFEHFGTMRSYAKYPQCELIFTENKDDKIKTYIFEYTSEISKKVRQLYSRMDNIIYYKDNKKVIRNSNGKLWFLNNEIVSQVCDNYGKTRCLILKIKDRYNISLYVNNPIPPLPVEIISYNESLKYNLDNEDEISNIMNNLNIKKIKKIQNVIAGVIEPYNLYMIINNKEENLIESYNKYQKISRCVLEHLYYLYSIFINDDETKNIDYNNLITFSNLNKFLEKYIEKDEGFNYGIVPNKLSLDNEGIIKNGKLIVKSDETLKRLIYSLKLKVIRDYESILSYHTLESMNNYYLDINDFDTYDTQLIFKGHEFISNWLNNFKNDQNLYILYNKVLPKIKTTYFIKNKLIGNDNIYIARNVKTIEEGIMYGLIWNRYKYVPEKVMIEDSNIINEYKISLYSYANEMDITKYYINPEKEDNDIKIIGYKDKIKIKNENLLISKYTVLLKYN